MESIVKTAQVPYVPGLIAASGAAVRANIPERHYDAVMTVGGTAALSGLLGSAGGELFNRLQYPADEVLSEEKKQQQQRLKARNILLGGLAGAGLGTAGGLGLHALLSKTANVLVQGVRAGTRVRPSAPRPAVPTKPPPRNPGGGYAIDPAGNRPMPYRPLTPTTSPSKIPSPATKPVPIVRPAPQTATQTPAAAAKPAQLKLDDIKRIIDTRYDGVGAARTTQDYKDLIRRAFGPNYQGMTQQNLQSGPVVTVTRNRVDRDGKLLQNAVNNKASLSHSQTYEGNLPDVIMRILNARVQ